MAEQSIVHATCHLAPLVQYHPVGLEIWGTSAILILLLLPK